MATRMKTFRLGPDLDDAGEIRAKQCGYPNGSAFQKGIMRYAMLVPAKHSVTLPWASLPLEEQDALDAALLVLVKAGAGITAKQAATITVAEIIAMAKALQSPPPAAE